ncbi:MAG: hypothetical protein CM1200mP20_11490 [Pseudomonadota bacterium]|nr:MAG: hypothetical protein CM1200mP20_11490 [Pseudomonadota bacterium]
MSNTATSKAVSNTATDTLARKSSSEDVISGGHLVAKALRNEGVDTIFTLCGGHIIDIYDGCLDEASGSSTWGMNRRQHMQRMGMPGRLAGWDVWSRLPGPGAPMR